MVIFFIVLFLCICLFPIIFLAEGFGRGVYVALQKMKFPGASGCLEKIDAKEKRKNLLEHIKKSRRYSPNDEQELSDLDSQLKLKTNFDFDSVICRKLWEYDSNKSNLFKTVDVPFILGKGEWCYFKVPSSHWLQNKSVLQPHSSLHVSIRIAKGLYYRPSHMHGEECRRNELRTVSAGDLYITNKRIIFAGQAKSQKILLGQIVSLEWYSDAIQIIKMSGKPDLFTMPSDACSEYVALIINELIGQRITRDEIALLS